MEEQPEADGIWRQRIHVALLWIVIAFVLCLPNSALLSSRLIGDPAIDVWNHAWGYWFVFQSILSGQLPLETSLIGAPAGGVLYFIDTPGAIIALPITALFGPAVGYNLVLLGRLAITGIATQGLTNDLLGEKSVWGWIAGWAAMTLPFLLCELSNGISEVCAIQWGICALWMTHRATESGNRMHWLGVGIFQGLTISSTFYYGLAFGLLLIVIILGRCIEHIRQDKERSIRILTAASISAVIALVVASPYAWTFWMSIQSDNRLVMRDTSLHEQLLRHNAVDPQVYWTWGQFQSVNLLEKYGEPFIHTGYLRWSLIPFAFWAGLRNPKLRLWLGTMIISLLLGLGNYLWWNEEWVYLSEQMISLPFDWIRQVLPQIAITHPLRLSIGGQIICVVLGIIGWKQFFEKRSILHFWWIPLCLITAESIFGSSAVWPIPHSNAHISDAYNIDKEDTRGIIDLPAEVGTSMETSRYFWFQSKHGRPIPYTPDARLGSTRDLQTFKNFMGDGMTEVPKSIDELSQIHMRSIYQQIVVHPNLDLDKANQYQSIFTEAFGPPENIDDLLLWKLEPVNEEDIPPDLETKTVSSPYSSEGEVTQEHSCSRTANLIEAHLTNTLSEENTALLQECHEDLLKHCTQRTKNPNIDSSEANFCIAQFAQSPSEDLQYAILHLFRHPSDEFKILVAKTLCDHPSLVNLLPKERLQQLSNHETPEVQNAIQKMLRP